MKTKMRWSIVVLCLCGIALSAVSLRNHYATTETGYCDLGEIFNCDLVNRSIYSRFMGIPVALIGAVGYAFLLVLTFSRKLSAKVFRLLASGVAVAFSLYLTYIEARVLAVWCLLCIASLIAIGGIALLSGIDLWRVQRQAANLPDEMLVSNRHSTSQDCQMRTE